MQAPIETEVSGQENLAIMEPILLNNESDRRDEDKQIMGEGALLLSDHPSEINSSVPRQKPATPPTPLAELFYECIKYPDFEIKIADVATGLISLGVGGLTCLLYGPIIHKASKGDVAFEFFFQLGGCGSNTLMGTFAASDTINHYRNHLPKDLRLKIGDTRSNASRTLEIIALGILSMAAALAPVMATEGGLVSQILVGISMTIIYWLSNRRMKSDAQRMGDFLTCNRQHQDYLKLVNAFTTTIIKVGQERLKLNGRIPEQMTPFTKLKREQLFDYFAQQVQELGIKAEEPLSGWEFFLEKFLPGISGSSLLLVGMVGYLCSLYEKLGAKIDAPTWAKVFTTLLISLPFEYLMAVIGLTTFISILGAVFSKQRPLAMQLYFTATIIMLGVNIGLAACSWLTAAQLINDSPYFQEGAIFGNLRTEGVWAARIASSIANLYGGSLIGLLLIELYAVHLGSPEIQERAKLAISLRKFNQYVRENMSSQIFADSILKLKEDTRDSVIPLLSLRDNVTKMAQRVAQPRGQDVYIEDIEGGKTFSRVGEEKKGAIREILKSLTGNSDAMEEARRLNANALIAQYPYGTVNLETEESPSVFSRIGTSLSEGVTKIYNECPNPCTWFRRPTRPQRTTFQIIEDKPEPPKSKF